MRSAPLQRQGWSLVQRVVALASLGLAGTSLGAEPAPAEAFGSLESDLLVQGMTFVGTRGDVTEFVVQAEHAVFHPDTRIANLREVDVRSSEGSPAGEEFTVRCDRGELDVDTNDFLAEGNVEGHVADGRRYAAPWVRYDHDRALLFTDAPVVMQDDTGTFRGDGFRYYVQERRFRLLGNVSLVQTP